MIAIILNLNLYTATVEFELRFIWKKLHKMNKYYDFIDDYPLFGLVEFRLKIPKIVKPLKIEIANIVYGYQQSHGFGLI